MSVHTLQDRRNQLTTRMRELVTASGKEDRELTAEERVEFEGLDKEQESLKTRIEDLQKTDSATAVLEAEREATARGEFAANPKTAGDRVTERDRELALRAFLLHDQDGTPQEWREAAKKVGLRTGSKKLPLRLSARAPRTLEEARQMAEARATSDAQNVGTAADGGNTVPNAMMVALEVALLQFGGPRAVARVIRTDSGATLPVPTADDTAATGAILAESAATTTQNVPFGQVTFSAYTYTSHMVPATVEFLQDTSINVAAFLGEMLGIRIGRIQTSHLTTGGGSSDSNPAGVVGGSTTMSSQLGVTSSTYGTVIYSELVDLVHSLDPAYRASPSCGWMFSDDTLGRLKKLVDGDSRPLWLPSIVGNEPDRLLGFPYQVNQSMPSYSTTTGGLKPLAFGDFSRFWIRDARDVQIVRFDERYMDLRQVAWMAFSRMDGGSVQYSAIRHLLTGST